jgi:gliding motility-associated-like protein
VEEYGYSFVIYNRWGEIVFESNDIYSGWDGTYKGLKCPDGIYTWVMQYSLDDSDGREEITGHLNLLK